MKSHWATPPHTVIDAQLDAYSARDIEAFAAYYAEDVVATRDGIAFVTGKGELRTKYQALFDASPDLHLTIADRRIDGERVYDAEVVTGHFGSKDELRAAVCYTVVDGLIVRVEIAVDRK